MSERIVSTEALRDVAVALNRYIGDVTVCAKQMKDAAIDCHDNMLGDDIAGDNIKKVEECAEKIERALQVAEELETRLKRKAEELEEMRRRNRG